jgi:hypothetical protein
MLLFTPDLDAPSVSAALKTPKWSLADLAREARLPEDHVRGLIAGRVHNSQSVRAVQLAVNAALLARRSA